MSDLLTEGLWEEDRYKDIFATEGKGETLIKIWRQIYGAEYPESADPFGFVTRSELAQIKAELHLKSGDELVDLGCGRGGPGLYIAQAAACSLTGIDVLEEAVAHAAVKANQFNLIKPARFIKGSFVDTGLMESSVDAVMSIDAFWMVLDKLEALREVSRILRPGGRFVMTTWMPKDETPHELFEMYGFQITGCHECMGAIDMQLEVYRQILKEQLQITTEIGVAATKILVREAMETPAMLVDTRRLIVIAERP